MKPLATFVVLALSAAGVATPVLAQAPIRYRLSFPDRDHHEVRVEAHFDSLQPGPLELRMSRSSPGRYALHEFAKNVYDVRAVGVDGHELPTTRPNPYQWNVAGHGGSVTVTYTLYADRGGGTYSQVDRTHAHLNIPATFMYARGLFERPVQVTFDLPPDAGWEVATQLVPTGDGHTFSAPDVYYFMDSPIEVADLSWRQWSVSRDGRDMTMRVAMHHLGTDAELDRYAEAAQAIADEEAAVFGTWPAFDFGTYTFLACYVPWASGDGMEHRNSTMLTSTGSLARSMTGLLGTVAHEFFHSWNMERIRSAELEPFDYEAADMSQELWFGEGFTSYYDDVALVRAGIIDEAEFVGRMGSAASTTVNAPGRRFFSPVEMSMQAPFVDAATSIDPTNQANTFLSYYTWGSAVGLGLDMTLRTRFEGVTLDDLMREMWRRHGEPQRPYTVRDIESALAAVTGDAAFAQDFFDRYVWGRDVPDFRTLFAGMGVRFGPVEPEAPYLTGAFVSVDEDGGLVRSNTLAGDPFYQAGIDRGDRILSLDGTRLDSNEAYQDALADLAPGDRVEVQVEGRTGRRTAEVAVGASPRLGAVLDPGADAAAARRREAWVASRAGELTGGRP